MKVEDLDVLRPESKYIRLGEKEIDVSFIPCGITFEVDTIIQELQKMDLVEDIEKEKEFTIEQKLEADKKRKEETKRAFELSIELCVAFCSHKHPELDKEWFYDNTDAGQIKAFSSAIKDALVRAYAGIVNEDNPKNSKAAKRKK